jgi:protein-S-isoprenylcysteine O-methyltransferase Ste14
MLMKKPPLVVAILTDFVGIYSTGNATAVSTGNVTTAIPILLRFITGAGRDRLPDLHWTGFFLIMTCSLIAYALRISVEEKALRENLGPEYVRYSDAPSG